MLATQAAHLQKRASSVTPAALTMLLQLHNGERELLSELKVAAQKRAGKRSCRIQPHCASRRHSTTCEREHSADLCEGGVLRCQVHMT
jgi:hypothetical protein